MNITTVLPDAGKQRLSESWTTVYGMMHTFTLTHRACVDFKGHVAVEDKGMLLWKLVAARLVLRSYEGGVPSDDILDDTIFVENIHPYPHYKVMPVNTSMTLDPGTYRISAQARMAPYWKGAVVLKDPKYSKLQIKIEECE